jgi:hypothetical protein
MGGGLIYPTPHNHTPITLPQTSCKQPFYHQPQPYLPQQFLPPPAESGCEAVPMTTPPGTRQKHQPNKLGDHLCQVLREASVLYCQLTIVLPQSLSNKVTDSLANDETSMNVKSFLCVDTDKALQVSIPTQLRGGR